MTWLRAGVGGMTLALLFAAAGGAQVTQFSERVFNEQVLRPRGQPVIPLYEGYYPNPDGTYEICFGYFNLNTEEDVDIPLGPNKLRIRRCSGTLVSAVTLHLSTSTVSWGEGDCVHPKP